MLTQVNQQFLQQHTQSGTAMLEQIQHVIVFFGGELTLWQKQSDDFCEIAREKTAGVNDLAYLRGKQISHIAVLLVSRFSALIEQKKTIKIDDWVLAMLHKLVLIQKTLKTVNDDMVDAYRHIVSQSILFLGQLHSRPKVSSQELQLLLTNYAHSISSELNLLADIATSQQLHRMHEIMTDWRLTHSLQLDKARVLLPVVHGPREGFLEYQYFCCLFEHEIEQHDANNNSVYCVEMLPKQMATLDIKKDLIDSFLAKSELDKQIGRYVFHDERAMFKDILQQQAEKQLGEMFKKDRNINQLK